MFFNMGGGMPFGMGGMNGGPSRGPVDTTLYELLRVSPNATDDEIKKVNFVFYRHFFSHIDNWQKNIIPIRTRTMAISSRRLVRHMKFFLISGSVKFTIAMGWKGWREVAAVEDRLVTIFSISSDVVVVAYSGRCSVVAAEAGGVLRKGKTPCRH